MSSIPKHTPSIISHSTEVKTEAMHISSTALLPSAVNRQYPEASRVDMNQSFLRRHGSLSFAASSTTDGNLQAYNSNENEDERRDYDLQLSETGLRSFNRSNQHFANPCNSVASIPRTQLTTNSAEADNDEIHGDTDEETGEAFGVLDEEEAASESQPTKPAVEQSIEKRKMKRFRLTHNQTRFLMSEFSRQAHPDAVHRERLSKEIPGLSPRQVQVWFQNRRAKLKRLTSNDRERMLKSRALPDNFVMAQVLHPPYSSRSGSEAAFSSPRGHLPSNVDHTLLGALYVDGIKSPNEDHYVTSPLSTTSVYGNYFPSPTFGPASENLSPISPISDRASSFVCVSTSTSNSEIPNPFSRSSSYSAPYRHSPNIIPRLQQVPERSPRARADSMGSSLCISVPYTGRALDYGLSGSADGLLLSYDDQQLLGSPISQSRSEGGSTDYSLNYLSGQFRGPQPVPSVNPGRGVLPTGPQLGSEYGQVSVLSSSSLPASQDYQFSQLGYPCHPDSSVSYAQRPALRTSLPSSKLSSEAGYTSQDGISCPVEDGSNLQEAVEVFDSKPYTLYY